MAKNIFILPIEPVESRYTAEWFKNIPKLIRQHANMMGYEAPKVIQIAGNAITPVVPEGQFLDFAATNSYKASQIVKLVKLFQNGTVKNGDEILITDVWNPAVLQIKYMLDLLDLEVRLHGIWHAGSYDKTDILGMRIKDKRWSNNTERALYYACDCNYFASTYHEEMFHRELGIKTATVLDIGRDQVVGWPMEYLWAGEYDTRPVKKEKIIVFPHRLSADKQPEIFRDLRNTMGYTGYEFVMTMENNYSKEEYHNLLARSQFVFSAALHENLGISTFEAMLHGAIPMLPDRVSYHEMYDKKFLYPKTWTSSWDQYMRNRERVIAHIENQIKRIALTEKFIPNQIESTKRFFNGFLLYEQLLSQT